MHDFRVDVEKVIISFEIISQEVYDSQMLITFKIWKMLSGSNLLWMWSEERKEIE